MTGTVTVAVDGTPLYRRVDGIGRYSANLVAATARARPDWRFVVVGFADDRSRPYLLPELPNVEQVFLPFPRRLYQAAYSYGVRVPVTRWLPPLDVLLATNYTVFPWLPGVPSAVVVYDLTYVDLPQVVDARNLGHLRRTVPRTMRTADRVLAISPFTAERIDATFPAHPPVTIVDCALDETFLGGRSTPSPAAGLPGLPEQYVLCVGTLEPRKNLVTLLRAYAALDEELRDRYPLVVVGRQGWGAHEVPSDVPADVVSSVRFTGYVQDAELPAVYRGARLFVFPSRYEGFGLPLLEAMACGVPAVVSAIPPFEAIGGPLVDYADPDDPGSFSAAIGAALRADATERTEAARAAARTWTWERSAQQLLGALEDLRD
ncbi:glycosyltransferase family 4 protein [Actinotalea sp.]|uniref:glycosyltransferase family 4 protein n=1 Tax=Actinotalea sp. TaxID=1872145 RepID=UPI003563E21E